MAFARRGKKQEKKTGIEVDPSVNKAASESNFGEKRPSQHEGGAVKRQVQADESGTGEALGWEIKDSVEKEKKERLLNYFGGV